MMFASSLRRRLPRRFASLLVLALVSSGLLASSEAAGQAPGRPAVDPTVANEPASSPAPTKLHAEPTLEGLISLPGDFVTMRYGVGSLDRAARLQYQVKEQLRIFERWSDIPMPVTVFVLSRNEWREGRVNMTYGLPVRIGQSGLAVPAQGDEETARFWQALGVALPSGTDVGFRGGAGGHAPSLAMADLLALHQVGEMLVDRLGLAGDEHWVRGLVTHVVTADFLSRHAERAMLDLDVIYRQILDRRGGEALAASDYRAVMPMDDWLWFQARFHEGAKILLDDEGRGALKKLLRLKERNDGLLAGEQILDRWDDLEPWYRDGFSAVSRRPVEPR